MTSTLESPAAVPAFTDLLKLTPEFPCDYLRSRLAYVYPRRITHYSDPRRSVRMPVIGARTDNGGSEWRALEFQDYEPGRKIYLVPFFDYEKKVLTHWAVYAARKERLWFSVSERDGTPIRARVPMINASNREAIERNKVRTAQSDLTSRLVDGGYQSPYKETRISGCTLPDGTTAPNCRRYYTHVEKTYNYESCHLVTTWTPAQIEARVLPEQKRLGFGSCPSTRDDFETGIVRPDCLANHYLWKDEDAYFEYVANVGMTLTRMVPILGTASMIYECSRVSDPYCWGEAGLNALSDATLVLTPFAKAAQAGKFINAAFIVNTAKTVNYAIVAGNSALAAYDFSQGQNLSGVLRLASGALGVFELRTLARNVGGSNRVHAYRTNQPKNASPPCDSVLPKVKEAPAPSCGMANGQQCCLRRSVRVPTLRSSIRADVVDEKLAPYVQDMFDQGPNRWIDLPETPQGEPFVRGMSGDYAGAADGAGEFLKIAAGNQDDFNRFVSLVDDNNCDRVVREVTSQYADPVAVKGRSEALFASRWGLPGSQAAQVRSSNSCPGSGGR